MSALYKLNLTDFAKGAVTAVVAAVIFAVAGVASQAGFDVFTADWGAILSMAFNAGVAAFVGHIGKNFMSDSEGKFMGKIG